MDETRLAGTGDGVGILPHREFKLYWDRAQRITRRQMFSILGLLVTAGFLGLQLIPIVPAGHVNKGVVREPSWDSERTRALAMRACGDCHSNQTDWPLFSYVAPASWVISNHVWKARNGMNFHNWDYTAGKPRTPDQVEESIREGRMPPAAYLFTHPQARLTAVETEELIRGLRATMEADPHAAAMFFEETGADGD